LLRLCCTSRTLTDFMLGILTHKRSSVNPAVTPSGRPAGASARRVAAPPCGERSAGGGGLRST
jgi:hypothetical protein